MLFRILFIELIIPLSSSNFYLFVHQLFSNQLIFQFRNIVFLRDIDLREKSLRGKESKKLVQPTKDIHSKKLYKKRNGEFHPAIIVTAPRLSTARTVLPSLNRLTQHERVQRYRDPRPLPHPSISSHGGFSKDDPTHRLSLIDPPAISQPASLNFGHAPTYVILHTSAPWPIFLPPSPLLTQHRLGIGSKFISNSNDLGIFIGLERLSGVVDKLSSSFEFEKIWGKGWLIF